MSDGLLFILSLISIGVIYWVLFGERKQREMMR